MGVTAILPRHSRNKKLVDKRDYVEQVIMKDVSAPVVLSIMRCRFTVDKLDFKVHKPEESNWS
jgi:hypothetical protein